MTKTTRYCYIYVTKRGLMLKSKKLFSVKTAFYPFRDGFEDFIYTMQKDWKVVVKGSLARGAIEDRIRVDRLSNGAKPVKNDSIKKVFIFDFVKERLTVKNNSEVELDCPLNQIEQIRFGKNGVKIIPVYYLIKYNKLE